jgi:hypothetical protein
MTRTSKPTDTHLMLLSAASQCPDGLLDLAARLKGQAMTSAGQRLLAAGLVEEAPADRDGPLWRVDEDGQRRGLKITPVGLAAISIERETEVDDPPTPSPSASSSNAPTLTDPKAPKPASKRALVLDLLRREHGASLADLTAATGWLPHTTRAALTGLRQKGHVLNKTVGPDRRAIYTLAPPSPEPQPAAVPAATLEEVV